MIAQSYLGNVNLLKKGRSTALKYGLNLIFGYSIIKTAI